MSYSESNFTTATEMFKQVFEQVAKDKQLIEEEKQKWEEEKAKIHSTFSFHGQMIDLNVGGKHYSTSRSTLTKYPESMLGVMFSGRHDLETMKCSDGSFFIDRDGARFKYILDYLRDGEEVVESFPKSAEILLGFLRDAKFYQLDGLVTSLCSLLRQVETVSQKDLAINFKSGSGSYNVDGASVQQGGRARYSSIIDVSSCTLQAILYKHKNMRKLSFNSIRFDHPLSFINCDLSGATFTYCSFGSGVTFEDCILDDTTFSNINGLVTNSHRVSFAGSNTDKTKFDANLRAALQSAKKI